MKKCELLIPVGNMECLIAAINNGADAVYLGGKKFGARAYSNNFDDNEMIEAIKKCHLYGVKVYVTVNTMIFNEERNEVLNYLKFLYINGVDAVIMQDVGMIKMTRKYIPNLEIHVSTQAHNHNEAGIKYFKDLGCTRVVFDRESSLEDINSISLDIEKEVFVYGALCVCYSGNCLFSALNGSRSANRGMCVGSCRMSYSLYENDIKKDEGFILSTKDLNTLDKLSLILDSGIDSLKIEGRMKSKEYVAVVAKTFRKLIDNYYSSKEMVLDNKDKRELLQVYNRDFTNGYLFNEESIINKKSSNHQGLKIGKVIDVNNKYITIKLDEDLYQEDAIRFFNTNTGMHVNVLYDNKGLLTNKVLKGGICKVNNKERTMWKDLINSDVLKTIDVNLNKELNSIPGKRIDVSFKFIGSLGKEIELSISDGINSCSVKGTVLEAAKTQPVTKDKVIEQLSKLGNTPFKMANIDVLMDDNLFISLKELNELRRTVVEELISIREQSSNKDFVLDIKGDVIKNVSKTKLSILVRNKEQLEIALRNNIDIIYVTDESLYFEYKNKGNVYLRLERVNIKHKEYNNEKLLCTEFGSIINYKDNNTIRGDYYLNVANEFSINELKNLNATSTLSVELSNDQLKNIANKEDSEVIVYGSLECMIIKNNIFNIVDKAYIKNDKGLCYKVILENGFTKIFNAVKLNKIDQISKLKSFGTLRMELLDESAYDTQVIINKVKNML